MSESKTIVITGGTGLVGRVLIPMLTNKGYSIRVLTTQKMIVDNTIYYHWNPQNYEIDTSVFEGATDVIHLAGASISKRWTAKYKTEIYDSRVRGTETLLRALRETKVELSSFVGSSAVGFYPSSFDAVYTEDHAPGKGFLARVCDHWERSYPSIAELGIPTSWIRTGIVLSETGGALEPMAKSTLWGLGSPLGTGKQWLSWIHVEDRCNLMIFAMENQLEGPYNGVGPTAQTQKEVGKTLAKVLKRPFIAPPVPAFALKLLLGEMSQLALMSQNCSADKIRQAGFKFQHTDMEGAIRNVLGK
jgi:uncharacterized protein (TIGR01777 family)